MSFFALLEILNFDFSKFEPFFKSQIYQIYQNSKLRVSEIVKMATFEILILPKIFSQKIEWQKNSCIVDLKFTFWKFLEHSVLYFFRVTFYRNWKYFYSEEILQTKNISVKATFLFDLDWRLFLAKWKLFFLCKVFVNWFHEFFRIFFGFVKWHFLETLNLSKLISRKKSILLSSFNFKNY